MARRISGQRIESVPTITVKPGNAPGYWLVFVLPTEERFAEGDCMSATIQMMSLPFRGADRFPSCEGHFFIYIHFSGSLSAKFCWADGADR